MRITLQPAFILHARPFRDTSLLIDMLTLGHGRINLLARNARGLRSRFKGLLQPFTPFLASWSGNTDLMYLSQVEANGVPYYLTGTALISGFYLNELLVRLLHRHDAHPNLFMAYQSALIKLQHNHSETALRAFELELLAELGYGLQLNKDAITGNDIVANEYYRLELERGFVKCFLSQLNQQYIFSGKCLLALHHKQLQDAEDFREAKRLLRLILASLLGDQPLKTRELFLKIEEEAR